MTEIQLGDKPSDFIEASIKHLDAIIEAGIDIDMSAFFGTYPSGQCYVCLGGAVLAGLHADIMQRLLRGSEGFTNSCNQILHSDQLARSVGYLFDAIRMYDADSISFSIKRLWPKTEMRYTELYILIEKQWQSMAFIGPVSGERIDALKKHVLNLANILKLVDL